MLDEDVLRLDLEAAPLNLDRKRTGWHRKFAAVAPCHIPVSDEEALAAFDIDPNADVPTPFVLGGRVIPPWKVPVRWRSAFRVGL